MAKLAKFLYSTALVVITAWLCSYFTRYGIATGMNPLKNRP